MSIPRFSSGVRPPSLRSPSFISLLSSLLHIDNTKRMGTMLVVHSYILVWNEGMTIKPIPWAVALVALAHVTPVTRATARA